MLAKAPSVSCLAASPGRPCFFCAYLALAICGLFIQGRGGQRPRLLHDPHPPQGAESCYLLRALLNFYLNTVFKTYHKKAAELRILKSFSTLANNFIVILSKLQPKVSRTKLGPGTMGNGMFGGDSVPLTLVLAFIPRQGVVRKEHRPWAPAVLGSSLALLPTSWLALCKVLNLSGLQFSCV